MDIELLEKAIIKCDYCEKEFIKTHPKGRFCSRMCLKRWHWKRDPRRQPKIVVRDLFAA